MITVPVILLPAKLASFTVLVLENKLFLSPGVEFSELCLWCTSTRAKNNSNGKKKSLRTDLEDPAGWPNKQSNKLPDFKVSTYNGERLNDDKWIPLVESTFRLSAMVRFLTDNITCKKQI